MVFSRIVVNCCGQETKTVDRSVEACNLESVVVAPHQDPKPPEVSHQLKATVPTSSLIESISNQSPPIQYVDHDSQTEKSPEHDFATLTPINQNVEQLSQKLKALTLQYTESLTQIVEGHDPATGTQQLISTGTQHEPIQTREKCNQASIESVSKEIQYDPIVTAEVGLQALVEKVDVTSTASPEVRHHDSQTNGLIVVVDQQIQTEHGKDCDMQTEQISTESKETQTEAEYQGNGEHKDISTCTRDNGEDRRVRIENLELLQRADDTRDRTDNLDRRGDRDRDNTAHYDSHRPSPSATLRTARKYGGAKHNDNGASATSPRTARKIYPPAHDDEQRPPSPRREPAHDNKTVYLPTADKDSNAVALFYKFKDFIKHFYSIHLNVCPLENRHQHPAILPCVGASRLGSDVAAAFTKSKLPSKLNI